MDNLSYAIEILKQHVTNENNKEAKILSLYQNMIDHILQSNNTKENLIDEIQKTGAIIATLFYMFDFKNEAKHMTLSTTRVTNISEAMCKTHPKEKMCLDCWKLSYLHCEKCIRLKLVHDCQCKFNCCEL